MLVYFTNSFKGNATDSIAINPDHVISVFEILNEEEEKVTAIYGIGNNTWTVEEPYLEVVSRMNQCD
jgi:hypothetical protein